jgi:feruloyl esterase
MTIQAKAITHAFYREVPKRSYWNGCSEGGNQGLSEAQRYPGDYDGIVAGAPANYLTHLQMGGNWISQAIHQDPASFLPANKMPALHRAVVEACDALDGVKDGVLEDPRLCHINLKALECKSIDNDQCLTAAQITGLEQVYAGAHNRRTGAPVFPGYMHGGELDWPLWIAGTDVPPRNLQHGIQEAFFKYFVFENPEWKWESFDFDRDIEATDRKLAGIVNATNPDLTAFKARGGKLIQYHGWSDAAISPLNSVSYYESVRARMGDTTNFYRLFMVPGMGHCARGDGPDQFDKVGTLAQWVEKGIAPDQIVAAQKVDGRIVRTRPLCPYGKAARWKGSGSTDDAGNFTCELNRESVPPR